MFAIVIAQVHARVLIDRRMIDHTPAGLPFLVDTNVSAKAYAGSLDFKVARP
jgi:hypothetical protein